MPRRPTTFLCMLACALAACCVMPSLASAALAIRLARVVDVRSGPVQLGIDVYEPVHRPRRNAGGRPPAVILVHGGGWVSGSRRSGATLTVARQLSNSGFKVFSIEYRMGCGTDGYPLVGNRPWMCGAWLEDSVSDVEASVAYIRSKQRYLGFDGSRVSLVGLSAGGHLSLLAATRRPDTIGVRHVANLSGQVATEAIPTMPDSGPYSVRRTFAHVVGCDVDQCPERWWASSPASTLMPGAYYPFDVLLVAGTTDPSQSIAGWPAWRRANRYAGVRTTYAALDSSCHAHACMSKPLGPRTKRTTLALLVEFLRR